MVLFGEDLNIFNQPPARAGQASPAITGQGGKMEGTKEVAMTKEEFCEAFRRALEKLTYAEVSVALGVSKSTIRRYAKGENAPCPALRGPAINFLEKLIQKKAGK